MSVRVKLFFTILYRGQFETIGLLNKNNKKIDSRLRGK